MLIQDKSFSYQDKTILIRAIHLEAGRRSSKTLVFLHDALGSIESWGDFPRALCIALQMDGLVYDRIGHGKSSASEAKRPLDYLEQEALEVLPHILTELQIEHPILIGCSDGASISLIYGASFPVQAIISIAGHIRVEEITVAGIKKSVEKLNRASTFEKLQQLHGVKTKALIDAWATIWLSNQFRNWNISHLLQRISCPTLVLQGANDAYATPQHAKDIGLEIGHRAKVIILEDCGHFPHVDQPEELIKLVEVFLVEKES